MPWWCLLQTGSWFLVFSTVSSSPVLPFSLCPPFLISWAVICEVSRTRRPVCISQLAAAAGTKRGRPQMYGAWGSVSGAAERTCPAWPGPQIYGVDVPLHLCARDEKIPLFFSHKHPPHPECSPPLPFHLSFRPILLAMLFRGTGIGSHRGEKKE